MRLVNTDGSPSELSGNGLRCLAALVMRERERRRGAGADHRSARRHRGRLEDAGADRRAAAAATRSARRWGSPTRPAEETLEAAGETLRRDDARHRQSAVRRADDGAARRGALPSSRARRWPRIRGFPQAPTSSSRSSKRPIASRILIWERGVGPTQASGTGACASAIAAIAHGGAARDVQVIAPGGTQRVEWRDDGVYLTGWAEVVFDATGSR